MTEALNINEAQLILQAAEKNINAESKVGKLAEQILGLHLEKKRQEELEAKLKDIVEQMVAGTLSEHFTCEDVELIDRLLGKVIGPYQPGVGTKPELFGFNSKILWSNARFEKSESSDQLEETGAISMYTEVLGKGYFLTKSFLKNHKADLLISRNAITAPDDAEIFKNS